ncbi:MAG: hypothetical protein EXR41_03810 [Candidatus Methylopumilus sp.]|nr:hypothetical protein [Candidatus Methylopumilus sp.]
MKKSNTQLTCPLCGKANQCVIAQGEKDIKKCWCYNVSANQELLSKLNNQNSCLCVNCLKPTKSFDG